ncbi:hypothetical protein [Sciscionella sediminilitoris]|uniref:hypothetical protein n=1 Tax=Sciscionella sediminilitoris TaxID=1445613 RepID=UPI0004DF0A80|nr:hypothetical protein [Sciscionella sp. SE31]
MREELADARRAAEMAVIPRLPVWVPVVFGVLVAGAITLAGWGVASFGWRLAAIGGGIVLAGAAVVILRGMRIRHGLRGLRGRAAQERAGHLIGALGVLVVALSATSDDRMVFAGLGIAAGAVAGVLLYRRSR